MAKTLTNLLRELWKDEAGLVSVEYALLTTIVAVGSVPAWHGMSETFGDVFDSTMIRLSH
jgi:Flp pilus assembly pilin Flp